MNDFLHFFVFSQIFIFLYGKTHGITFAFYTDTQIVAAISNALTTTNMQIRRCLDPSTDILTQRGHAAQHKLRAAEWEEGSQQAAQARQLTATLADALRPARAHPDWEERPGAPPVFDPGRDALTQRVASLLPAAEPETPAASPGAARQPETPAAWHGE